MRKVLLIVSALLLFVSMGLACPSESLPDPTPDPAPDPTPDPVEPEPDPIEPEPPPHTGAWVDEVIITVEESPQAAVLKLKMGILDIYTSPTVTTGIVEEIGDHPDVEYVIDYGSFCEFRFNTYRNPITKEPVFRDGRLNPFAIPEVREAVNWLIDRQHIVDEYLDGRGVPRWTALGTRFTDHLVRYPQIVTAIEEYYAPDPDKAAAIINAEMQKLGALRVGGMWYYKGQPVEIIIVIRSDNPPFPAAGHYIADRLEALGFTVTRLLRTGPEAIPLWWGDPADGLCHIVTLGWRTSAVPRDQVGTLVQMHTHRYASPWWAILEEQLLDFPELAEAARRLTDKEFTSMEEREELFETALWEAMRFSNCVWLADIGGITPFRHNVALAADVAGGVYDPMWAHTIHFHDDGEPLAGGTLRMAMHRLLLLPWNPVDGSAWWYDLFVVRRALGDAGTLPDTRDGLHWPQRIQAAKVYVRDGLPVDVTHDWLTLEFVPEIVVPPDAWADWDAVEQRFITVAERSPQGATAVRKSVVTYPADIFAVPLHDGSTLSIGDFVMSMIMAFDRGKEASPIYDAGHKGAVAGFLNTFKGVRIASLDPLVIETYSDIWHLDAELNVATWFPTYGTYSWTGFWHMITVGWLAEKNAELAFSHGKAGALGVEWMDYTRGPSILILKKWLDWAAAENYVPYAPTLGQYISADEATERWANLQNWYADKGHFWVGNGPFYLEAVYPEEKIVHLKRFEDYPDPSDKWLFLLQPLQ